MTSEEIIGTVIGVLLLLLQNQLMHEVNGSTLKLFEETPIVNEAGKSLKIAALRQKAPVLILRFTQFHYGTCIEASVQQLKEFSKSIGMKSIVVLGSYANQHSLLDIKEKYPIQWPMYNIATAKLATNYVETLNYPYFFILEPEGSVSMLFIPNKSDPSSSAQYLESTARYLHQQESIRDRSNSLWRDETL